MGARLLLLAMRLSMIGTLVVVIVVCLRAMGRWRKGVSYRLMVRFSVAGVAIPLLMYPFWIYADSHFPGLAGLITTLALVFWPSSIGLMALESPGRIAEKLLFVSILMVVNAGLYGLVGLLIGFVWERLYSGTPRSAC